MRKNHREEDFHLIKHNVSVEKNKNQNIYIINKFQNGFQNFYSHQKQNSEIKENLKNMKKQLNFDNNKLSIPLSYMSKHSKQQINQIKFFARAQ